MTINLTKPYHVYLHGKVKHSGSYQECLNFLEEHYEEDQYISRTKSEHEDIIELSELPIDYTIDDDDNMEDDDDVLF